MTDGRFADTSPVFTADGLYLAFLSQRSFDPVYDAQSFDLSFPFGSRPYLVPLAAGTPSPFGPLPGGAARRRGRRTRAGDGPGGRRVPGHRPVDGDGVWPAGRRGGAIPVERGPLLGTCAPVKGGLVWLRAPVTGVLGEGGAGPDDDRPRPALERFDLRKREVTELAGELDWFAVSGDGTRLRASATTSELRVLPSGAQGTTTRARPSPWICPGPGSAPTRPRCGGTPTPRPGGSAPGLLGTGHVRGGLGRRAAGSTGRCWTGSAARPTSPTCSGKCSASWARRTPT